MAKTTTGLALAGVLLLFSPSPQGPRGPMAKNLGDLITRAGPGETETIDFEKVSIQIYSHVLPKAKSKVVDLATVAAEVRWKNRKCQ